MSFNGSRSEESVGRVFWDAEPEMSLAPACGALYQRFIQKFLLIVLIWESCNLLYKVRGGKTPLSALPPGKNLCSSFRRDVLRLVFSRGDDSLARPGFKPTSTRHRSVMGERKGGRGGREGGEGGREGCFQPPFGPWSLLRQFEGSRWKPNEVHER